MDPIKRLHGVYRAVVKDNKDPKNLRRILVQVQSTGSEVTDWAWPVQSTIKPPAVGQGVWITYIGGDPEYPIWLNEFGKNQSANKRVYIKPLENKVSLTGLSTIVINTEVDGTKELDLTDTLVLMAQKIKDHETRITALEASLTLLHNTLATRTSPSHTHTSNG